MPPPIASIQLSGNDDIAKFLDEYEGKQKGGRQRGERTPSYAKKYEDVYKKFIAVPCLKNLLDGDQLVRTSLSRMMQRKRLVGSSHLHFAVIAKGQHHYTLRNLIL